MNDHWFLLRECKRVFSGNPPSSTSYVIAGVHRVTDNPKFEVPLETHPSLSPQATRKIYGFQWDSNSCHLDSFLMAALTTIKFSTNTSILYQHPDPGDQSTLANLLREVPTTGSKKGEIITGEMITNAASSKNPNTDLQNMLSLTERLGPLKELRTLFRKMMTKEYKITGGERVSSNPESWLQPFLLAAKNDSPPPNIFGYRYLVSGHCRVHGALDRIAVAGVAIAMDEPVTSVSNGIEAFFSAIQQNDAYCPKRIESNSLVEENNMYCYESLDSRKVEWQHLPPILIVHGRPLASPFTDYSINVVADGTIHTYQLAARILHHNPGHYTANLLNAENQWIHYDDLGPTREPVPTKLLQEPLKGSTVHSWWFAKVDESTREEKEGSREADATEKKGSHEGDAMEKGGDTMDKAKGVGDLVNDNDEVKNTRSSRKRGRPPQSKPSQSRPKKRRRLSAPNQGAKGKKAFIKVKK
jgi:hypothetical protein